MEKTFEVEVPPNNEEVSEKTDLDLEKTMIDCEFSSPWDDSDLILVVEDQKLHVHRSVLKMASPVFKNMLSSDFKEKDAKEVPLPGKKVDEFVDFLRQIYPLLDGQITLKNIKSIYSLADEYQMTKVLKDCRMFLFSAKKTKENAMDMLLLAQDMEAEEARQQCCDVMKKMTVTELERMEGFAELNGPSMKVLILTVVKRLQQCINQILPEFLGSLDGMMYLWSHKENAIKMGGVPRRCSKHKLTSTRYQRGCTRATVNEMSQRIKCDECRVMFKIMARNACGYISPSQTYLSEKNVSVLEEMLDLIKEQ